MSPRVAASTPIGAYIDGAWKPLRFANETPAYPCRVSKIR